MDWKPGWTATGHGTGAGHGATTGADPPGWALTWDRALALAGAWDSIQTWPFTGVAIGITEKGRHANGYCPRVIPVHFMPSFSTQDSSLHCKKKRNGTPLLRHNVKRHSA